MKIQFSLFIILSLLLFHNSAFSQDIPEKLMNNKHNEKGLPVGNFNHVDEMIQEFSKDNKKHIVGILNKSDITLYEASYAMYYLAIIYLHEGDVKNGVKAMHIAAEDYLNPIALSEMARIYYHGSEELHHIFPKEHLESAELDYEKDLEKSFVTLNLAFQIANHIKRKHGNSHIYELVGRDGTELLEKFTFKNEADKLKDSEEHKQKLREDLIEDLKLLAIYKKIYDAS